MLDSGGGVRRGGIGNKSNEIGEIMRAVFLCYLT